MSSFQTVSFSISLGEYFCKVRCGLLFPNGTFLVLKGHNDTCATNFHDVYNSLSNIDFMIPRSCVNGVSPVYRLRCHSSKLSLFAAAKVEYDFCTLGTIQQLKAKLCFFDLF